MSGFLYASVLQWKLDLRNRDILVIYYIVPLLFFLFMGGVFTSIMPETKTTLTQSMTIFGITMGAVVGAPTALSEMFGSEIKCAYHVGNIPLWTAAATNFISVFLHLMVSSAVICFLSPLVFDATAPTNLGVYFGALAITLIASILIGTVFGMLVKGSKLTMLAQVVFLPSIMLSGIMFPAEMLPKPLLYLGKLFPATWGFKLMTGDTLDFASTLPLMIIIVVMLMLSGVILALDEKRSV